MFFMRIRRNQPKIEKKMIDQSVETEVLLNYQEIKKAKLSVNCFGLSLIFYIGVLPTDILKEDVEDMEKTVVVRIGRKNRFQIEFNNSEKKTGKEFVFIADIPLQQIEELSRNLDVYQPTFDHLLVPMEDITIHGHTMTIIGVIDPDLNKFLFVDEDDFSYFLESCEFGVELLEEFILRKFNNRTR
uniref:Uncharacterized protein n=1 Tax=Panagrolaimus sp. JU765 TaxID=591449 RepID=A0AC34QEE3_9BILA